MLPLKPQVLKKRSDFLALKNGSRLRGPFFLLVSAANGLGTARVGYTVTKKQGNAVRRNRMKRRLRALVHLESVGMAAGRDYVLLADASLLNADHETLRAELAKRLADAARGRTTRKDRN
jgi:ribonuclease P protein component